MFLLLCILYNYFFPSTLSFSKSVLNFCSFNIQQVVRDDYSFSTLADFVPFLTTNPRNPVEMCSSKQIAVDRYNSNGITGNFSITQNGMCVCRLEHT